MSVGENIQKFRKNLGLSQEELGERLHVSRQTVSQWEKDTTVPTIDNLMLLKDIFNVSVDDILCGTEGGGVKENKNSLDTICASLAYAVGVEAPACAAGENYELSNYVDKVFAGQKADRLVMYNPDAVAEWIYRKYPWFFENVKKRIDIEVPLATVMPSVTPVCFGTMYTGARPEVHGIRKYEKPVITIDTLFDSLIRAGKRIALITYSTCSLSKIYLERDIDYYHSDAKGEDGITFVNAKAAELILADKHDVIIIYNGNYDSVMHKKGPESVEALSELRVNCNIFSFISELISNNWKHHNTLLGFAMDHGCHEIDGNLGSHGLDMTEDINIVHLYKGFKKEL